MMDNQFNISPNSIIECKIIVVSTKFFIIVEYSREYEDRLYTHSDVNNVIQLDYNK